MFEFLRKVEKVSPTMYKIGDDVSRAEYAKGSNTWNAYGKVGDRFRRIGMFSSSEEAIRAAKRHKVK
ncbi:MAG: hypothetical protein E4H01_10370 [Lysobacterales bacterium]|nr:MAG: hypothetical protein E4H01_10370 [Xanthomonadales bacterium]